MLQIPSDSHRFASSFIPRHSGSHLMTPLFLLRQTSLPSAGLSQRRAGHRSHTSSLRHHELGSPWGRNGGRDGKTWRVENLPSWMVLEEGRFWNNLGKMVVKFVKVFVCILGMQELKVHFIPHAIIYCTMIYS